VVLSDIDHFKRFNDTHGHACGDHVLREAAGTLRATVREQDMLARWGGEEFIMLLPETDAPSAALTADRSREAVAATSYAHEGQALHVSMTFGVSEFRSGMSLEECVRDADRALYEGKAAGRNRVTVWRG
jgi:diguanylate cyclase (GGDEF)-like protein